jgi:hypothetical protein
LDTLGSDTDTVLAVYVQNFSICTNLFTPLVGCNNDRIGACDALMGPPEAWNRASGFSFLATSNAIYRVVIDSVGGIADAAVQFNVVFQTEVTEPAPVILDQIRRGMLHPRGTALGLAVDPAQRASGDTYQWLSNGRPVAGATRPDLLLPSLDFSDAARYAVTIRNGTAVLTLPGVTVAVVEPCRSPALAEDPARVFWWGATGEPARLEWTDALTAEPAWLPLGPYPVSVVPMLWITTEGGRGFYRWAGEAP